MYIKFHIHYTKLEWSSIEVVAGFVSLSHFAHCMIGVLRFILETMFAPSRWVRMSVFHRFEA